MLMLPLLLLLFVLPATPGTQAPTPGPSPAAAYEQAWSDLLQQIVMNDGLVRYDLLAGSLSEEFATVVSAIETFDVSTLTSETARLAFWMNAYNVKMVERVLAKGTPANIERAGFDTFFKTPVRVAGRDVTLDEIENVILRRQPTTTLSALQVGTLDPRIHVGLNCGAVSCPRLRSRAFTAGNVSAELDRAMGDFVNSRHHFRVEGETAVLSSLLDWFGSDFDAAGKPAGDYLLGFMDDTRPDAAQLRSLFEGRTAAEIKAQPNVRYAYRWDLNTAK